RGDHLAELGDDLAEEDEDPLEEIRLLLGRAVRRDDVARSVLGHSLPFVSQLKLTRRADRNRTCNLRFWRPLLCQLSYRPRGPRRILAGYLRSIGHDERMQTTACSSVRHAVRR